MKQPLEDQAAVERSRETDKSRTLGYSLYVWACVLWTGTTVRQRGRAACPGPHSCPGQSGSRALLPLPSDQALSHSQVPSCELPQFLKASQMESDLVSGSGQGVSSFLRPGHVLCPLQQMNLCSMSPGRRTTANAGHLARGWPATCSVLRTEHRGWPGP